MDRPELLHKLRRLVDPKTLAEAEVDLAALAEGGDLPRWLEQLAAAADALPLPEVPTVVSQDLQRIFDDTLVEAHQAVLIRDTRHQERELSGVRGADLAEGWSLSYTSPMADVVLDVWPRSDGTLDVVGHVMAHGSVESAYRAKVHGPRDETVAGDRLGRFRLESLPPGRYSLVVGNGEIELSMDADLEAETS